MNNFTRQAHRAVRKQPPSPSARSGDSGDGAGHNGPALDHAHGSISESTLDELDGKLTQLLNDVGQMGALPSAPLWVSPTVLICRPPAGRAQHNELNENPHKTWVVTGYAEPLSWCFLQLQDILPPAIDYIDRDDVFGHLADNAIEFLSRTSAGELNFEPQVRGKALLLFVIQSAKRLLARSRKTVV